MAIEAYCSILSIGRAKIIYAEGTQVTFTYHYCQFDSIFIGINASPLDLDKAKRLLREISLRAFCESTKVEQINEQNSNWTIYK